MRSCLSATFHWRDVFAPAAAPRPRARRGRARATDRPRGPRSPRRAGCGYRAPRISATCLCRPLRQHPAQREPFASRGRRHRPRPPCPSCRWGPTAARGYRPHVRRRRGGRADPVRGLVPERGTRGQPRTPPRRSVRLRARRSTSSCRRDTRPAVRAACDRRLRALATSLAPLPAARPGGSSTAWPRCGVGCPERGCLRLARGGAAIAGSRATANARPRNRHWAGRIRDRGAVSRDRGGGGGSRAGNARRRPGGDIR